MAKIALITGASQGIGAQMARTFQQADATIVINHPEVGATGQDAERLAATLPRENGSSTKPATTTEEPKP